MSKKINPEKLTLGIKKDFRKDSPKANSNIDSLVQKIHSTTGQGMEEETKRTTLDIPKSLHKKISRHTLEKDLSLKDYFLGLAMKDMGME
jgi:hypothetical protein